MSHLRKRHLASALVLGLILASSSFVALNLTSLEWPFASASPFSANPFGGPKPAEGFLLINATHLLNGALQLIPNASVSLFGKTHNRLLETNVTDAKGMIGYNIPSGSYFVTLDSKFGSASRSVEVYGSHTTVVNYLSINQTEVAISFDILTQQPNIVAPWDTVYVELPNILYGLNLSAVSTFIEPAYLGYNASGPARSFGIFRFPTSPVQIPAKIVSVEPLTSGTTFWIQLKPSEVFSSSSLAALQVLEYNSTMSVGTYNSTIPVR